MPLPSSQILMSSLGLHPLRRRAIGVCLLSKHAHVDFVRGEVPEHLDQVVWEGVEVDVEFAV